ncbi:hypothetical protein D3C71_1631730 [compost metagenome]
MILARHRLEAGVGVDLAFELFELPALRGVDALLLNLAGVVAAGARGLERHLGIAAQCQALFLAVEAVLPEPPPRATGLDLQIEAAGVGEAQPQLVGRAEGLLAGGVGEHGGTISAAGAKTVPVPPSVPPNWRNLSGFS